MKQFPKKQGRPDSSAMLELQIQQIIIGHSAESEWQHICMLIDSQEDKKDLWLIYELCEGKTLNELCFEVKGEFYKGDRIYMVHHSEFYHRIRNDMGLLRQFIGMMADALALFAKLSIVHADLKPDNVILDYCAETNRIQSLKIIDLGSAFLLNPEGTVVES